MAAGVVIAVVGTGVATMFPEETASALAYLTNAVERGIATFKAQRAFTVTNKLRGTVEGVKQSEIGKFLTSPAQANRQTDPATGKTYPKADVGNPKTPSLTDWFLPPSLQKGHPQYRGKATLNETVEAGVPFLAVSGRAKAAAGILLANRLWHGQFEVGQGQQPYLDFLADSVGLYLLQEIGDRL